MSATDLEERVCRAIRAILLASAPLAALMGTVRVVDAIPATEAPTTPFIAFGVSEFNRATDLMLIRFVAIVDTGEDGLSVARHILDAIESALTTAAFLPYALDLAPLGSTRGDPLVEIEGSPNLRQADLTLPLMVA